MGEPLRKILSDDMGILRSAAEQVRAFDQVAVDRVVNDRESWHLIEKLAVEIEVEPATVIDRLERSVYRLDRIFRSAIEAS